MKSALPSTTIIVATLYAFSAVADGSNNSIELDLQGDRLKPEITQDGNDNTTKLKLVTTAPQQAGGPPVDISNGQNAASIIQRGNKNFADVSQTLTPLAPNLFQGQTMELNQLGNSNRATIKSNIQTSMDPGRKATHIQQGDNNTLDVNYVSTTFDRTIAQVGNGNKLSITNIGDYYKSPASTITQTGDNNTASSLSGSNATILQTGNANNAKMHSTTIYPVSIQQKGDMNNADLWASGPMMMGGGSGIVQEGRSNYASLNAKSTGIALQQKGNSNTAIGSNAAASFYTQEGNRNTLTFSGSGNQILTQKGDDNTANSNAKANNLVKIEQTGNSNYASQDSNHLTNSFAITQTGKKNRATQIAFGENNTTTITQTGDANIATQKATGNFNELSILQNGSGNVASQIFTGNSNKSTISQTGTNHAANLNITGNSNNFNITQEGAGQKFSMNRVGNSMTMNIVQK